MARITHPDTFKCDLCEACAARALAAVEIEVDDDR